MKPNVEPIEQLEVVVEDIPNLVDARTKVCFCDHLVGSDMEIAKHLVMGDLVAIGDELCVVEHLVVSLECVDGYLHISIEALCSICSCE